MKKEYEILAFKSTKKHPRPGLLSVLRSNGKYSISTDEGAHSEKSMLYGLFDGDASVNSGEFEIHSIKINQLVMTVAEPTSKNGRLLVSSIKLKDDVVVVAVSGEFITNGIITFEGVTKKKHEPQNILPSPGSFLYAVLKNKPRTVHISIMRTDFQPNTLLEYYNTFEEAYNKIK